MPSVKKSDLLPKITFKPDFKVLKEVLLISLPRTVALASNQISLIVLLSIAGTLVAGSIAIFSFSFNLQGVPMAIIGLSYSLAAFPMLSRLFEDKKMSEFADQISRATRHIIFWSVPVMVMFIVLRAQIVRTILGSGEFSWSDTRLVAAALAIFSISVVAQSLILLFVRGFYAAGQTKKPLMYSVIGVLITIFSAYGLVKYFESNELFRFFTEDILRVSGITGTVVLMLPLAYSIGMIVNALLLWISFNKQFKCFSKKLTRAMFHTLGAGIIMGQFSYIALQYLDDIFDIDTLFGIFMQGFLAGIFGIAIGAIVLVILDNEEIKVVWKTLHKKFWKTKPVVAEEDVHGTF
jgi:putative peptidoglycan lipid II flippase